MEVSIAIEPDFSAQSGWDLVNARLIGSENGIRSTSGLGFVFHHKPINHRWVMIELDYLPQYGPCKVIVTVVCDDPQANTQSLVELDSFKLPDSRDLNSEGTAAVFIELRPKAPTSAQKVFIVGGPEAFIQHFFDSRTPNSVQARKFVCNAYSVADPFYGVYNRGFHNLNRRKSHLNSLARYIKLLGFNTTAFQNWTYDFTGMPAGKSLEFSTVHKIATLHKLRTAFASSIVPVNAEPEAPPLELRDKNWEIQRLIFDHHGKAYSHFRFHGMLVSESFLKRIHLITNGASSAEGALVDRIKRSLPRPGNLDDYYSNPFSKLAQVVVFDEYECSLPGLTDLFRLNPATARSQESLATLFSFFAESSSNQITAGSFHADFIDFLAQAGFTAAELGENSLGDVEPVDFSVANPPANYQLVAPEVRRKFLATVQFIQHNMALGFNRIAKAFSLVIKELGGPQSDKYAICFGSNSFFLRGLRCDTQIKDRQIRPECSDTQKEDDQTSKDEQTPKYEHILPEYFELFRANLRLRSGAASQGKHHPAIAMWLEVNDQMTHDGLFRVIGHAEFARSVSMLSLKNRSWPSSPKPGGPGEFGFYSRVVQSESDTSNQIVISQMLQAGRGAKIFNAFEFGPYPTENSWAQYPSLHPEIEIANKLLAAKEYVLFPGRPSRRLIAILATHCSDLWYRNDGCEGTWNYHLNELERIDIATALAHEGFGVDYVDETDIRQNALILRQYRVLYVLDPNLPEDLIEPISAWVSSGGRAVFGPFAATHNELNLEFSDARSALNQLQGIETPPNARIVQGAVLDIVPEIQISHSIGTSSSLVDIRNGPNLKPLQEWPLKFAAQDQAVCLAKVVTRGNPSTPVTTDTGEIYPALVAKQHGTGFVYTYAIHPGLNYTGLALHNSEGTKKPVDWNWNKSARAFAVRPVLDAGIFKQVTAKAICSESDPSELPNIQLMVDQLESKAGMALIVYNLNAIPQASASLPTGDDQTLVELTVRLRPQDGSKYDIDPVTALGSNIGAKSVIIRDLSKLTSPVIQIDLVLHFRLAAIDVVALKRRRIRRGRKATRKNLRES